MMMPGKWHRFTQKQGFIDAWGMQEDNIRFFDKRFRLIHVFVDMLLEKTFVLPTHLGTDTGHNFCTFVLVKLTTSLFLTANIFGVGTMK